MQDVLLESQPSVCSQISELGDISPRPGEEEEPLLRAAGARWGPGVAGQIILQWLAARPGLWERQQALGDAAGLDKGRGKPWKAWREWCLMFNMGTGVLWDGENAAHWHACIAVLKLRG